MAAIEARNRADELAKQVMAQSEELSGKARERGLELVENAKESAKKAISRVKKAEDAVTPVELTTDDSAAA